MAIAITAKACDNECQTFLADVTTDIALSSFNIIQVLYKESTVEPGAVGLFVLL